MKSVKSAVVVIPPQNVWPQIQELRKKHDKAYGRWMPHVNLLYPFLEDSDAGDFFKTQANMMCRQLATVKPFTVALTKESFGAFHHGRSSTYWVKPVVPSGEENEVIQSVEPVKKAARESKSQASSEEYIFVTPQEILPESRVLQVNEITSYSCPIPQTSSKPTEVTGLDALRYAIWTPENTISVVEKERRQNEPGLGALRFAFWTPEDNKKAKHHPTHVKDNKKCFETTKKTSFTKGQRMEKMAKENKDMVKENQVKDRFERRHVGMTTKVENPEEEESSEEENEEDWSGASPGQVHPGIMRIQEILQDLYPGLDDLRIRSPEGFQPHLTLGQGSRLKPEFDASWKDVEFEVKEVCLISRRGFNDPFSVKQRVPLGSFETNDVECP